jgi:hypothetical protein
MEVSGAIALDRNPVGRGLHGAPTGSIRASFLVSMRSGSPGRSRSRLHGWLQRVPAVGAASGCRVISLDFETGPMSIL